MSSNEVMHYGVKGMKWGQRRADRRSARLEKRNARAADKEKSYQMARSDRTRAANQRTAAANAQLKAASKETGIKGLVAKSAARSNARDVAILNARLQYVDHKRDYKDAKKQYKIDKQEKGKAVAKEIFKKERQKFIDKSSPAMDDTAKELLTGFVSHTLSGLDKSDALRRGW